MKELGRALQKGFNDKYEWPLKEIQNKIKEKKLNDITPPSKKPKELKEPEGHPKRKELICEKININEVLRAITYRIYKSNKNENYEEYEFIGDCVLKLLATIEAFVQKPTHE
jgi:hypothetical protein